MLSPGQWYALAALLGMVAALSFYVGWEAGRAALRAKEG